MAGGERGGAEAAFVDICIAMHNAGENIEVVTRPNDIRVPMLQQAGITVHTLHFGGYTDVFTRWRLSKIIRAFKPDIVQTWMARATWKTPAWKEFMGIPRYALVARLGGYYKLKYFKSADYFIANTPDIRRYLIEEGVPADKVWHINNFAEIEAAIAPLNRSDVGTPSDVPLLLALGRLHHSKAFDTLIRAVALVPEAWLWIAGEGKLRKELEDLIAILGIQSRVKLLGWRSDRAALFQACDICVVPSRFEPFGNVFVQAWAQQKPLITTASVGPSQYVRDEEDALVTPVDDVEALAGAIRRLIADETLQRYMVEKGYSRYQAEFTKEKTIQAYLELYHALHERTAQNL